MKAIHLVAVVTTLTLLGCAGKLPLDLGVANDQLTPCPKSPNCVSSDELGDKAIAPLPGLASPEESLARWEQLIQQHFPKAQLITREASYLHFTFKTSIGWVDDVELYWRDQQVQVRSASRLGYSDLGKNRQRIESLRQLW